jgi:hypothetical protein
MTRYSIDLLIAATVNTLPWSVILSFRFKLLFWLSGEGADVDFACKLPGTCRCPVNLKTARKESHSGNRPEIHCASAITIARRRYERTYMN